MHNQADLLWTAIWLIAAALTGAAAIFVVRAWRKRYHASELAQPFTLQDLRAMRDRGDISAAEFETMKTAVVGMLKSAPAAPHRPARGPADAPSGASAWLADSGPTASGRPERPSAPDEAPDDRPHVSDGGADANDGGGGDAGGGGGNGGGAGGGGGGGNGGGD